MLAPVILPGVPGSVLLTVLHLAAEVTPHTDVPVTQRLPTVKPGATLTDTELVPCPVLMVTAEGAVQL